MPISAGVLIRNKQDLVTTTPSHSLEAALRLMIEHDFSQLPVLDGSNGEKPLGVVTGDSISRASFRLGTEVKKLFVADAIIRAKTFFEDDDLFDLMDGLLSTSAVLITDADKNLRGIVTGFDTTQYFRQRAEDIMLVEDIEMTLRSHIRSVYKADENNDNQALADAISQCNSPNINSRTSCQNALKSLETEFHIALTAPKIKTIVDVYFPFRANEKKFSDLTLNEYIELALSKPSWKVLQRIYNIDKEALRSMLNGTRDIRNKLVHFRSPVSDVERDHLRFCAQWFRNHPFPSSNRDDEDKENGSDSLIDVPTQGHQPDKHELDRTIKDESEADTQEELGLAPLSLSSTVSSSRSKYSPIASYLSALSSDLDVIGLTFEQIEESLRVELPPSAREHPSWWANDSVGHVQSRQWLQVGWRVSNVNMLEQEVTFTRMHGEDKHYIDFFSSVQNAFCKRLGISIDVPRENGRSERTLITCNYEEEAKAVFSVAFLKEDQLRLKCFINTGDQLQNTSLFNLFRTKKKEMEARFGQELVVETTTTRRLKNAIRIVASKEGSVSHSSEERESLESWAVEKAVLLHQIVEGLLNHSPPGVT